MQTKYEVTSSHIITLCLEASLCSSKCLYCTTNIHLILLVLDVFSELHTIKSYIQRAMGHKYWVAFSSCYSLFCFQKPAPEDWHPLRIVFLWEIEILMEEPEGFSVRHAAIWILALFSHAQFSLCSTLSN